MVRGPELPSAGEPPGRSHARSPSARFHPARYVRGLLLGQGVAWLVVATAGLPAWIVGLPPGLSVTNAGRAVLWSGVQLLAIAAAACIGAIQIGMACRMAGGPRLVLAMASGVQNVALAVALVLTAFLIMVGGSMLELRAVGGLGGKRSRLAAAAA